MILTDADRQRFDAELDEVYAALPAQVREWLEQVPLVVEDFPDDKAMRRLKLRSRELLCGLFVGISKLDETVHTVFTQPNRIYLFRLGVLSSARSSHGRISKAELRRQIRITILHELGHHLGMDEDELERLGYG